MPGSGLTFFAHHSVCPDTYTGCQGIWRLAIAPFVLSDDWRFRSASESSARLLILPRESRLKWGNEHQGASALPRLEFCEPSIRRSVPHFAERAPQLLRAGS